MPEETYRFKAEGLEELEARAARAARSVAELEGQIDGYARLAREAGTGTGVYASQLADLSSKLQAAQAAQRQADAALQAHAAVTVQASTATQKLVVAGREAGQGLGGLTTGLTKAAYAADDLQYVFQNGMGLRPILNNLATVSPYLFAAGLAIDQLIRHWEGVEHAVQGTALETPLKTIKNAFLSLGEAVGFVKDEAAKFHDAIDDAAKKGADALGKLQNPQQKARTDAVKEALEATAGKVDPVDEIIAARKRAGAEFTPEGEAEQRKLIQGDLGAALGGDSKAAERIIKQTDGGGLFGAALSDRLAANDPERKEAAKEQEEQTKREIKEAEDHNTEVEKLNAERAKALAAGNLGNKALRGLPVSNEDVQQTLAGQGIDVGLETAADIRQRVVDEAEKRVTDRAQKDDITAEQARQKLIDEDMDKARKSAEDEQAKRKKDFDDRLEQREEETPGFKQALEASAQSGFAQGGAAGAYQRALSLLKTSGLEGPEAEGYAREFAADQQRDAFGKFLKGEKPRNSEVLSGGSALSDVIQKSVGGDQKDFGRQQVDRLDRIVAELTRLNQRPPENRPYVFRR